MKDYRRSRSHSDRNTLWRGRRPWRWRWPSSHQPRPQDLKASAGKRHQQQQNNPRDSELRCFHAYFNIHHCGSLLYAWKEPATFTHRSHNPVYIARSSFQSEPSHWSTSSTARFISKGDLRPTLDYSNRDQRPPQGVNERGQGPDVIGQLFALVPQGLDFELRGRIG